MKDGHLPPGLRNLSCYGSQGDLGALLGSAVMGFDLFRGQKPEDKACQASPAYLGPSPERKEDNGSPSPRRGALQLKCMFAPISGLAQLWSLNSRTLEFQNPPLNRAAKMFAQTRGQRLAAWVHPAHSKSFVWQVEGQSEECFYFLSIAWRHLNIRLFRIKYKSLAFLENQTFH